MIVYLHAIAFYTICWYACQIIQITLVIQDVMCHYSDMTETVQTEITIPSAGSEMAVSAPLTSDVSKDIQVAESVSADPQTQVVEPVVEEVSKSETETNVLGDTGKTEVAIDDKDTKAEVKPDADTVKTESEKPEKVEFPIYEEFKLPENVAMEKEPMEAFTKLIGEIEIGKLDHAAFQEKGQALVDMHIKGVQNSIDRLNDYYVKLHEKQKSDWFDSFKKDPELGGNEEKVAATVGAVRDAIVNFGGDAKQVQEFRDVMTSTGVGSHPAVIRLINNMAAQIQKYTTESDNGNGGSNRMVPASRPAPSKVKDYARFYAGSQS